MSKTSNWHEFYEPYIPVRSIFRTDTIVDKYIKENYPKIIEEQFEIYKAEGKYKRASEFIENEIKPGLRNPDSYFLELKKGNKKDITGIIPNIQKLPFVKDYIDDLEHSEYDKDRVYFRECLMLGATLVSYPRFSHYLLWIFSTTDDNSEVFSYGSVYLNKISRNIKDNVDKFETINEEDYSISLDCYQRYFNIDIFLTKESIIDFYIEREYYKIIKDQYKIFKKTKAFNINNQEEFIKKMVMEYIDDGKSLYHNLINRKRKMDNDLLKKFRDFPILRDKNSIHYKNIEKLTQIRTALQMGALAFQKFPHLATVITNAINNSKGYLKELSKSFALQAFQMYEEEQFIESEIREEEYYRTNSEEIKTARLIGFDV